MNIDANTLFGIGVNVFFIGTLILAFGFKRKMSLTEMMDLGRELMIDLDKYFKKWPILIAKTFWFFGVTLVLISIALTLFKTITS